MAEFGYSTQGAKSNYAAISTSASADVLALVTGCKIRVVSLVLVTLTAVTVKFQSGGTSDLTGAMAMGATGVLVLPLNERGWFETVVGEKLNLVLGTGVAVAGGLTYVTYKP